MPSFNIPSGVSSLYLIVTYTVGQYDPGIYLPVPAPCGAFRGSRYG